MRPLSVSVCHSLSLFLTPGCSSQCWGGAADLKRLYALDDFSAITSWAEAINPLHMFHLRPKKQNKLICPKLRGPHFISPTQGEEEVGNPSSNDALLPSLFQLGAAILNLNRFWKSGLITYANEKKAIIKLSTKINGFNRGEPCNRERCPLGRAESDDAARELQVRAGHRGRGVLWTHPWAGSGCNVTCVVSRGGDGGAAPSLICFLVWVYLKQRETRVCVNSSIDYTQHNQSFTAACNTLVLLMLHSQWLKNYGVELIVVFLQKKKVVAFSYWNLQLQ